MQGPKIINQPYGMLEIAKYNIMVSLLLGH